MSKFEELEKKATEIREAREALNLKARDLKEQARVLSRELNDVERAISEVKGISKARKQNPGDVVMTVEAARVVLKSKG